jgi:sterol 3beta-glucosyltransferase
MDVYLNLKGDLKERFLHEDMPDDFAPEVREYATDPTGAECPPLNVVIFIVGSRGEFFDNTMASVHV